MGEEANVDIRDNANATIDFGQFSGDEQPGTIISMSNTMYVEMNSYNNSTGKGFLARLERGMKYEYINCFLFILKLAM